MIKRVIKARQVFKFGKPIWMVVVPKDLRGKSAGRRFFGSDKKGADAFAKQLGDARKSVAGEFLKLPSMDQSVLLNLLAQNSVAEIVTAVTFWRAQRPKSERTVEMAAEECLLSKKQSGARTSYLSTFSGVLKLFASNFSKPLHEISATDIQQWINGNGWKPWTRKTKLKDVSTLFNFAKKRGWVIANPCDAVERPRVEHIPPAIFSVGDCDKLLKACLEIDSGLLGYFCPILFGGLRPNESGALLPGNVRDGVIDISGAQAKLRKRRVVKINETLAAWLAVPGVEFNLKNSRKRFVEVLKKAEIKWGHDILRHSFCSYSLPKFGARITAEMAGHSESVLFRHYREIVTPEAAEKFWNLRPAN